MADIFISEPLSGFSLSNNSFSESKGGAVLIRGGSYSLTNNSFYSIDTAGDSILQAESITGLALAANLFSNCFVARVVLFSSNSFPPSSPGLVSGNVITNITGTSNGIGLHLENSPNLLIQNNQFNNISFPSFGGREEGAGVYIDEPSTGVTLEANSFSHCSASIGGAISFKNGFVTFNNNLYSSNEANLYGTNLAAFPVSL